MLNAIIVDDEARSRRILQQFIQEYCPSVTVLATAEDVLSGVKAINTHQPDVVFLDIEMPELSGLEILSALLNPPKVILTTAYSEYALKSYDYGVVDYLLKPVKIERFLKAVNKVSAKERILPTEDTGNQELRIKHDGLPIGIPFQSILYIQSFFDLIIYEIHIFSD